ncbi:MAG: hypothetical protein QHI38_09665 [Armatimonadota bacterium]|nr:hypothetical protein [Armatimonadota bacterium]
MKTIRGISVTSGIAIAVGAVVDSAHGLGLVSPKILEEGLKALKTMLPVQDYPEVVVVCDTLTIGASLRIPGINAAAIVAESELRPTGIDISVPCVVGLPNLLRSVGEGDILIVDGGKGVVHIDPDVETIVRYQHMQERRTPERVVYVSSEHLPAKTATGETVCVYAFVYSKSDLEEALSQGADGVIVDSCYWELGSYDNVTEILRAATGKPIVFIATGEVGPVLQAAARYAAPGQVSIVFSVEYYEWAVEQAKSALELAIAEALVEDLPSPKVLLGVHMPCTNLDSGFERQPEAVLIDLRQASDFGNHRLRDVRLELDSFDETCPTTIAVIGSFVDMLPGIFYAGFRAVAVEPRLVSTAKTAVREIGVE